MSKIPNSVKALSVRARITPILLSVPLLMAASTFSFPVYSAETFVEAAKNTVSCRDITNTEDRLACFDTTAKRLAELLNPLKSVTKVPEVSEPVTSTAESPAITTTDNDLPIWAEAPQHTKEELSQEKRERFETTIVRITVNRAGRHSFYTKGGAVWKQTQSDKVFPPQSLPALAEIRRKRTGNPTIKFIDVSNRSYRVLRVK